MNMPLLTYIAEISPRPVLFIHGEKAHSRYCSETAFAAAAEPKELVIIKGANHVDLDESSAIFPPFHINYGKNTKIGKNVFINFDCVFLDFGGITIEDSVFIAPKVCTPKVTPCPLKIGTLSP